MIWIIVSAILGSLLGILDYVFPELQILYLPKLLAAESRNVILGITAFPEPRPLPEYRDRGFGYAREPTLPCDMYNNMHTPVELVQKTTALAVIPSAPEVVPLWCNPYFLFFVVMATMITAAVLAVNWDDGDPNEKVIEDKDKKSSDLTACLLEEQDALPTTFNPLDNCAENDLCGEQTPNISTEEIEEVVQALVPCRVQNESRSPTVMGTKSIIKIAPVAGGYHNTHKLSSMTRQDESDTRFLITIPTAGQSLCEDAVKIEVSFKDASPIKNAVIISNAPGAWGWRCIPTLVDALFPDTVASHHCRSVSAAASTSDIGILTLNIGWLKSILTTAYPDYVNALPRTAEQQIDLPSKAKGPIHDGPKPGSVQAARAKRTALPVPQKPLDKENKPTFLEAKVLQEFTQTHASKGGIPSTPGKTSEVSKNSQKCLRTFHPRPLTFLSKEALSKQLAFRSPASKKGPEPTQPVEKEKRVKAEHSTGWLSALARVVSNVNRLTSSDSDTIEGRQLLPPKTIAPVFPKVDSYLAPVPIFNIKGNQELHMALHLSDHEELEGENSSEIVMTSLEESSMDTYEIVSATIATAHVSTLSHLGPDIAQKSNCITAVYTEGEARILEKSRIEILPRGAISSATPTISSNSHTATVASLKNVKEKLLQRARGTASGISSSMAIGGCVFRTVSRPLSAPLSRRSGIGDLERELPTPRQASRTISLPDLTMGATRDLFANGEQAKSSKLQLYTPKPQSVLEQLTKTGSAEAQSLLVPSSSDKPKSLEPHSMLVTSTNAKSADAQSVLVPTSKTNSAEPQSVLVEARRSKSNANSSNSNISEEPGKAETTKTRQSASISHISKIKKERTSSLNSISATDHPSRTQRSKTTESISSKSGSSITTPQSDKDRANCTRYIPKCSSSATTPPSKNARPKTTESRSVARSNSRTNGDSRTSASITPSPYMLKMIRENLSTSSLLMTPSEKCPQTPLPSKPTKAQKRKARRAKLEMYLRMSLNTQEAHSPKTPGVAKCPIKITEDESPTTGTIPASTSKNPVKDVCVIESPSPLSEYDIQESSGTKQPKQTDQPKETRSQKRRRREKAKLYASLRTASDDIVPANDSKEENGRAIVTEIDEAIAKAALPTCKNVSDANAVNERTLDSSMCPSETSIDVEDNLEVGTLESTQKFDEIDFSKDANKETSEQMTPSMKLDPKVQSLSFPSNEVGTLESTQKFKEIDMSQDAKKSANGMTPSMGLKPDFQSLSIPSEEVGTLESTQKFEEIDFSQDAKEKSAQQMTPSLGLKPDVQSLSFPSDKVGAVENTQKFEEIDLSQDSKEGTSKQMTPSMTLKPDVQFLSIPSEKVGTLESTQKFDEIDLSQDVKHESVEQMTPSMSLKPDVQTLSIPFDKPPKVSFSAPSLMGTDEIICQSLEHAGKTPPALSSIPQQLDTRREIKENSGTNQPQTTDKPKETRSQKRRRRREKAKLYASLRTPSDDIVPANNSKEENGRAIVTEIDEAIAKAALTTCMDLPGADKGLCVNEISSDSSMCPSETSVDVEDNLEVGTLESTQKFDEIDLSQDAKEKSAQQMTPSLGPKPDVKSLSFPSDKVGALQNTQKFEEIDLSQDTKEGTSKQMTPSISLKPDVQLLSIPSDEVGTLESTQMCDKIYLSQDVKHESVEQMTPSMSLKPDVQTLSIPSDKPLKVSSSAPSLMGTDEIICQSLEHAGKTPPALSSISQQLDTRREIQENSGTNQPQSTDKPKETRSQKRSRRREKAKLYASLRTPSDDIVLANDSKEENGRAIVTEIDEAIAKAALTTCMDLPGADKGLCVNEKTSDSSMCPSETSIDVQDNLELGTLESTQKFEEIDLSQDAKEKSAQQMTPSLGLKPDVQSLSFPSDKVGAFENTQKFEEIDLSQDPKEGTSKQMTPSMSLKPDVQFLSIPSDEVGTLESTQMCDKIYLSQDVKHESVEQMTPSISLKPDVQTLSIPSDKPPKVSFSAPSLMGTDEIICQSREHAGKTPPALSSIPQQLDTGREIQENSGTNQPQTTDKPKETRSQKRRRRREKAKLYASLRTASDDIVLANDSKEENGRAIVTEIDEAIAKAALTTCMDLPGADKGLCVNEKTSDSSMCPSETSIDVEENLELGTLESTQKFEEIDLSQDAKEKSAQQMTPSLGLKPDVQSLSFPSDKVGAFESTQKFDEIDLSQDVKHESVEQMTPSMSLKSDVQTLSIPSDKPPKVSFSAPSLMGTDEIICQSLEHAGKTPPALSSIPQQLDIRREIQENSGTNQPQTTDKPKETRSQKRSRRREKAKLYASSRTPSGDIVLANDNKEENGRAIVTEIDEAIAKAALTTCMDLPGADKGLCVNEKTSDSSMCPSETSIDVEDNLGLGTLESTQKFEEIDLSQDAKEKSAQQMTPSLGPKPDVKSLSFPSDKVGALQNTPKFEEIDLSQDTKEGTSKQMTPSISLKPDVQLLSIPSDEVGTLESTQMCDKIYLSQDVKHESVEQMTPSMSLKPDVQTLSIPSDKPPKVSSSAPSLMGTDEIICQSLEHAGKTPPALSSISQQLDTRREIRENSGTNQPQTTDKPKETRSQKRRRRREKAKLYASLRTPSDDIVLANDSKEENGRVIVTEIDEAIAKAALTTCMDLPGADKGLCVNEKTSDSSMCPSETSIDVVDNLELGTLESTQKFEEIDLSQDAKEKSAQQMTPSLGLKPDVKSLSFPSDKVGALQNTQKFEEIDLSQDTKEGTSKQMTPSMSLKPDVQFLSIPSDEVGTLESTQMCDKIYLSQDVKHESVEQMTPSMSLKPDVQTLSIPSDKPPKVSFSAPSLMGTDEIICQSLEHAGKTPPALSSFPQQLDIRREIQENSGTNQPQTTDKPKETRSQKRRRRREKAKLYASLRTPSDDIVLANDSKEENGRAIVTEIDEAIAKAALTTCMDLPGADKGLCVNEKTSDSSMCPSETSIDVEDNLELGTLESTQKFEEIDLSQDAKEKSAQQMTPSLGPKPDVKSLSFPSDKVGALQNTQKFEEIDLSQDTKEGTSKQMTPSISLKPDVQLLSIPSDEVGTLESTQMCDKIYLSQDVKHESVEQMTPSMSLKPDVQTLSIPSDKPPKVSSSAPSLMGTYEIICQSREHAGKTPPALSSISQQLDTRREIQENSGTNQPQTTDKQKETRSQKRRRRREKAKLYASLRTPSDDIVLANDNKEENGRAIVTEIDEAIAKAALTTCMDVPGADKGLCVDEITSDSSMCPSETSVDVEDNLEVGSLESTQKFQEIDFSQDAKEKSAQQMTPSLGLKPDVKSLSFPSDKVGAFENTQEFEEIDLSQDAKEGTSKQMTPSLRLKPKIICQSIEHAEKTPPVVMKIIQQLNTRRDVDLLRKSQSAHTMILRTKSTDPKRWRSLSDMDRDQTAQLYSVSKPLYHKYRKESKTWLSSHVLSGSNARLPSPCLSSEIGSILASSDNIFLKSCLGESDVELNESFTSSEMHQQDDTAQLLLPSIASEETFALDDDVLQDATEKSDTTASIGIEEQTTPIDDIQTDATQTSRNDNTSKEEKCEIVHEVFQDAIEKFQPTVSPASMATEDIFKKTLQAPNVFNTASETTPALNAHPFSTVSSAENANASSLQIDNAIKSTPCTAGGKVSAEGQELQRQELQRNVRFAEMGESNPLGGSSTADLQTPSARNSIMKTVLKTIKREKQMPMDESVTMTRRDWKRRGIKSKTIKQHLDADNIHKPCRLLAKATIHQGWSKLVCPGVQCTSMAYLAVLRSKLKEVTSWTSEDLDTLIRKGDEVHSGRLAELKRPQRSYLHIDELDYELKIWNRQFNVTKEVLSGDIVKDLSSFNEDEYDPYPPLEKTFQDLRDCDSFLLRYLSLTIAIIRTSSGFVVYDSHARDHEGYADPRGCSVLLMFDNVNSLIRHIRHFVKNKGRRENMFDNLPLTMHQRSYELAGLQVTLMN
ncbi:uncharacterized protein LOC116602162 [Nematostella vectensis]|uniref:uncharacterized protein LOC116602162 n=1 Tax=Nematostella vectensis TaxID=45351 RepID=UPI0020770656|nr:uncharacterized protein LOC116602162 [Nematostella vectensis]